MSMEIEKFDELATEIPTQMNLIHQLDLNRSISNRNLIERISELLKSFANPKLNELMSHDYNKNFAQKC